MKARSVRIEHWMKSGMIVLVAACVLAGCWGRHSAALSQQGADAVLWQRSSAEAYLLYQQGFDLATARLEANVAEVNEEQKMLDSSHWIRRPLAVIVDIDETVLDNSPYYVDAISRGRTFSETDWKAWTDRASAKALPGAKMFLDHAAAKGCEVFYITNRGRVEKESTLRNLKQAGLPFADETHLLLMGGSTNKTERRAGVAATHRVVLLVGDQLRDFDERFKDRGVNNGKNAVDALADTLSRYFVLVPNPMYGTFRDAIQGNGTEADKLARMKAWFENNGY